MHNFPKMDKKFTNTKKHPYFILSALLIILSVITICIFIFQKPKGGNDTGMFEKNSNRISIYYKDKMILTVTGEDQKQFVSYLKEIDLMNYTETKKDDTYQYKIDCNNNWGIVYLSPLSQTCYLKNDDIKCYTMPEHAYSFFFEILLKKKD